MERADMAPHQPTKVIRHVRDREQREAGEFVREELTGEGVSTESLLCADGLATSRSSVLVGPDGERTIVNHRDPRLFDNLPALPEPFSYDAALADTRWPRAAERILHAARTAGRPAVLDAEMPIAPATGALEAASHIAFSEQGLADWAGTADQPSALARAARRFGAWVCVTRGAAPVLVHDGVAPSEVPAFAVEAVDTLGAGDVWHGAFALYLAEGLAPAVAVRHANGVAALKTTAFGGREALPSRARLDRFLEENRS